MKPTNLSTRDFARKGLPFEAFLRYAQITNAKHRAKVEAAFDKLPDKKPRKPSAPRI